MPGSSPCNSQPQIIKLRKGIKEDIDLVTFNYINFHFAWQVPLDGQ